MWPQQKQGDIEANYNRHHLQTNFSAYLNGQRQNKDHSVNKLFNKWPQQKQGDIQANHAYTPFYKPIARLSSTDRGETKINTR